MTNTFTQRFQGGTSLTESQLVSALSSLQTSLSNISLATTSSTSYQVLRSTGPLAAPVFNGISDVIENNTFTSTASKKVLDEVTNISSSAANILAKSASRSTGSSVTNLGVASNSGSAIQGGSSLDITLTTSGRPVLIHVEGYVAITNWTSTVIFPSVDIDNYGNVASSSLTLKRDSSIVSQSTYSLKSSNWSGTRSFTISISAVNNPFYSGSFSNVWYIGKAAESKILYLDAPAAGTYTYSLSVAHDNANIEGQFFGKITAFEVT